MGVRGFSRSHVDSAAGKYNLICKFCVVVFLICSEFVVADFNGAERDSLMKLKDRLDPNQKTSLHKDWQSLHCYGNASRWKGIRCTDGRATELFLESMGLDGSIPLDAFTNITKLIVLSFKNNILTGNLPDFSFLPSMHRVDFSDNKFNGTIHSSLVNLNQLEALYLQNNELSGSIPPFSQPSLKGFNVSNNELTGSIPDTPMLSSFNESAYLGNDLKCGKDLIHNCTQEFVSSPSPGPVPSPELTNISPSKTHHSAMHSNVITLISLVAAAALLVIVLLFLSCYRSCKDRPLEKPKPKPKPNTITSSTVSIMKNTDTVKDAAGKKKSMFASRMMEGLETVSEAEKSKLFFLKDESGNFDLEDLLLASAEMLGKGSFGSSYKAVLRNGSAMVVKRLTELNNLAKEEFEKQIGILGRLRHENLVSLTSYYYAQEEKLLIYNYMPNGNLFDLLHGTKEGGRETFDWKSRVKVARSIARGIEYLHEHWSSRKFIPHGNIKSSNILIDENNQPRLSDYGLAPLIFPAILAQKMVAFKSPEYFQTRKVSFKSDVWSFGIILLELLTGKVPSQYGRAGVDLPRFVQTVVREEWTAEIFDREIAWKDSSQRQMLKMLQVAMDCTHTIPEKRPNMSIVVKRLEEIEGDISGEVDEDRSVSDYDSSVENTSNLAFSVHSSESFSI